MKLKKWIKEWIYEKRIGLTISPENFLPMLITSSPEEILSGQITFQSVIEASKAEEIEKNILEENPGGFEDGYMVNFADLYAIAFTSIPLIYDNEFRKPSQKLAREGTAAVIITKPSEFRSRIEFAIAQAFPNMRSLEVVSAQYTNEKDWHLYNKPQAEKWKKEFFFCARLNSNLLYQGGFKSEPVTLNIGDLSDIAICIPTKELIKSIPGELCRLKPIMDSFVAIKSGIQGWTLSVMGNFQDIIPIHEWIELFQAVIGNVWKANTVLEKLYADGASLPRISFYNGDERIYIGINRIEFMFVNWNDREKNIVADVLHIIDEKVNKRFCQMFVITNANLGTADERIAFKDVWHKEERLRTIKGLAIIESIEIDYCISQNILGINRSQRSWHYMIKTSLPDSENVTWYSLENVIDFFDEVADYNRNRTELLLGGNGYAGYRKM